MKDKEKQINNLANTLYNRQDKYDLSNPFEVAKCVIDLGYRKIDKDKEIVLSREEYDKLITPRLFIKPRELNQKELAEKLKNEKYGIIGVDSSSIEIIPSRAEIEKETAEKIYKDLKLLVPDNALGIVTRYFKEIMEIEIKE